MFDNNYGATNIGGTTNSRLLVVHVDETTMTANVSFQYELDVYSNIFGDNDRLPTGNVLACYSGCDAIVFNVTSTCLGRPSPGLTLS